MVNDPHRHSRENRRMRHLRNLLGKTRVHSIRMKILEELRHEFERTGIARLPAWLRESARRGAIGTAAWGRRTRSATARRAHAARAVGRAGRQAVGRYARAQAEVRADTRPARQAAKLARREGRQLDRGIRAKNRNAYRAAHGRVPLIVRVRMSRFRPIGFVRANKVAPRKRAATAPNARKAPAARITVNPLPSRRPGPEKREASQTRAPRATPAPTAKRPARTTRKAG